MGTFSSDNQRTGGLGDSVYHAIRRQISVGRLLPGAHLTETVIAGSLGVSRTPVREGLAALAREGLLVRQGRSYVVPAVSLEDIQEVHEMRCLLEPEAIRQTCGRLTESDMEELRAAMIAQRVADHENDAGAFIAANRRFREALFAPVRNTRLRRSIALYSDHMHFVRVTLEDPEGRQVVLQNLDRFLVVLAKRDAEAAARMWQTHITDSHHWVREWVRDKNADEEEFMAIKGGSRRIQL